MNGTRGWYGPRLAVEEEGMKKQKDDKKYTFKRDGAGSSDKSKYKAVKTATGYRIEASIAGAGASIGKEIGFDMQISNTSGIVRYPYYIKIEGLDPLLIKGSGPSWHVRCLNE